MANQLGMAEQQSIITLAKRGWSYRRIARELGIHRETASRYVRLASGQAEQAHGPPPSTWPKPAIPIAGSADDEAEAGPAKPAISIAGSGGRRSQCEPFREAIIGKLEQGLTAQRIWQDLVAEHGFAGSYLSVQRFVRKLRATTPLPFRRMECAPGDQAQVDFGKGAPVVQPGGRHKRPHLFRIVLSHSRKAYSEVVYRQTTESFIRCLENAFWHFGGVPRTLVVDNLKAAVLKADWFDPVLNPKIQAFCVHYGTVILPTKPRTPRHKGKIERQVGYAQSNALKAKTFTGLEAQNRYLREWETHVADTRIHGTTRKQVGKAFEEVERDAILPLPASRFPFFQEGQRVVSRDAHVEVDKAFYSVPPEYLGRRVWVRWDTHMVRVFDQRMEKITVHPRGEPGRFRTRPEHIAREKISGVEKGTTYLLNKAGSIGPHMHSGGPNPCSRSGGFKVCGSFRGSSAWSIDIPIKRSSGLVRWRRPTGPIGSA